MSYQTFKSELSSIPDKSCRAQYFVEYHGIVDYDIKGDELTWYKNYPKYLGNPAYTVKHTLNLVSLTESTQVLKRLNKRGWNNR